MSPNLSRNDIAIVTNSAVDIEPGARNLSRDGITKFSSDQTLGEMISPTSRTRCLEMSRNCPKFQTSYQAANGPTRRLRAMLSATQARGQVSWSVETTVSRPSTRPDCPHGRICLEMSPNVPKSITLSDTGCNSVNDPPINSALKMSMR